MNSKLILISVMFLSASASFAQTDTTAVVAPSVEEDTVMLGEVVVKGLRPQYRKTAEGMQTNVEGTVLAKLGTAEDVLQRVPMVSRKADGSWEVFGKGSPLIYLNGRKLENLSELDNLKAADIKSVEVIQSPGAKYAANVGSVVRIKTITPQGEGFSVDARTTYYYDRRNSFIGQANVNYRHGGLNVFGLYKFSSRYGLQDADYDQVVQADTLWQQQNSNWETSRLINHYLQGGLSYDFNQNHSIGARYAAALTTKEYSIGTITSHMTANGNYYDNFETRSRDDMKDRPEHDLNAYYYGKVGQTVIDFNTNLFFSHNVTLDHTTESSQTYDSRDLRSESSSRGSMVASKLVLTTPLFGGNLSYGAEYIQTRRKDVYTINRTDLVANSDSKIRERTLSPFVEYSRMLPIGALTAGLRYEDVRFRYYEDGEYLPDQSRNFRNFFPSLSFGTQLGHTALQLSYAAKTKRPSYSQLSNNISYGNRFTHQTGNPLLTHQTDHTLTLSGAWSFLQMMLEYKDSRNAIIYWAEQMPENEAITLIKYKNEKSIKSLTAYVSIAPTIGRWSPQVSAGMIKQWFTLHTDMGNYRLNKPVFIANLNNTFTLPAGFTAFANFAFQGKGQTVNAELVREQYVLDLGVSKSLLKDALTLELKGNDLFYQKWDSSRLYSQKMSIEQRARYATREVRLTLRYKFNLTRSRYKGTGAGNAERSRL